MLLLTDEGPCNLSRRWSVCLLLRLHDPPSPYLAPQLRRTGLPRHRHLQHNLNLTTSTLLRVTRWTVMSNIITVEDKRTFDVKGILHLARRVLLRHKHGVKVPECRLDKAVGGHLGESARSAVPTGVGFLQCLSAAALGKHSYCQDIIRTHHGSATSSTALVQSCPASRRSLHGVRSRLHPTPAPSAAPPPPHSSWARPLHLVASPTRTAPANNHIVEKRHTPCQRKSASSPPEPSTTDAAPRPRSAGQPRQSCTA